MNATIEEQVARYSRAMTATLEREAASGARPLGDYATPHRSPTHHRRSLWAIAALFVALVALAAGAAVIGGGNEPAQVASPTDAGDAAIAEDLLDQTVALVVAGRADEVCAEVAASEGFCHQIYDELDPARVPTARPTVVGSRVIDTEGFAPGLVLTVCGVDGLGDAYVTDMELLGADDAHRFQNPIYWSNLGLIEGTDNGDGTATAHVGGPNGVDANARPAGCPTGS